MSKADHAEGQRELTVQEKAIVAMRRDLIGVRNKVLGEFLLLTKESGAVDTTSAGFKEMHNSLMAINEKANQLSLQATEEGVLKRIEKLQKEGLEQGVGQKLKDDMVVLRQELESVLSSKENLEKGLVDYCKMRTLQTSPFQVIETKDTPMRKAGEPRPMGQDEIAELYGKLQPALSDIDIPVTSLPDIAAMGSGVVDGRLSPIARKRMEEFFGKKDGQGNLILDREKLTPENIKAFGIAVNEDLANELAKMKAERLINEAIAQMESKYKVTYKPEIAEKIKKNLEPSVTALGSEYMEANRRQLTDFLSASIRNRQGYLARATGNYPTSDLEKVARQFSAEYQPLADLHQQESIDRSLRGLQMANSKIAEKLTELGVEKAKALKYDAAKIPDEDLVRMRRENPEQFDRIVLERAEIVPDRQLVVDLIIDRAVYKLTANNGVTLTPERERDLKSKFKEQLTPALSKLDTGFLQDQSENISDNIQKKLYQNRSLGYSFGGQFSVAGKSLVKISNGIIADYQKPSADFELQTLRLGMGASQANNTELEKRLNALAVEKASAVKYNANEITSKDLREIRQQNPTLFDQVVLEKKPAAKQVVAAPVQEQVQVVAPPLQAPPLLSEYQNSQAALAKEQQKVRRPLPLPREGGVDSSRSGQELMAAAFREHQEAKGSPPPSRDSIQNGRTVSSKDPRGERRSPPPLPRKASQNQQEGPVVLTGEPLHPPTTPRPRSEGRGSDGHSR
jgi:hypothetical protein